MLKQKKGITLIALVITIIVLLILAGVSISAVMGENGIATKAKQAKEETRAGEVQEVIDLWKTEVSAKELDTNWGTVKTEDEVLQELLDSGKVEETEINRTEKTITIGSRVIDYSVEVSNSYEIKTFSYGASGCQNNVIALYNKATGEYEEFGERVIIEVEGEIFDGDVSEYIEIGYESDGRGYPDDTVIFDLNSYLSIIDDSRNVKVTIYKNGLATTWEGTVENIFPS